MGRILGGFILPLLLLTGMEIGFFFSFNISLPLVS